MRPFTQQIRSSSRALCAVLAGLWVMGVVTSLLHTALVPHVTCAVHGELVHTSSHAAPVSSRKPLGPRAVIADAPVPDGADADDHCGVFQTTRSRTVLAAAILVELSSVLPAARPAMVDRAVQIQPDRVLLSAPKTSPPRA